MSKNMMCPLCGQGLETDGGFTYEDVCGSNIYSMKHICVNKDCECSGAWWCDNGDFFSGDMGFSLSNKIFPNDNYGALNSFTKKMEVEIYKCGLKKKIMLHQFLTFGWLLPYFEINYKGNEMGEVLSKSYKLQFLKKNERGGYCIHFTSMISMLIYYIKGFRRAKKRYKEHKTLYSINSFIENITIENWNPKYKKTLYKIIKFLNKDLIYKILDEQVYYNIVKKHKNKTIDKDIYNDIVQFCPSTLDPLTVFKQLDMKSNYIKKMQRKNKIGNLIVDK